MDWEIDLPAAVSRTGCGLEESGDGKQGDGKQAAERFAAERGQFQASIR